MKRTVLAVVLAVGALALLASLVLQSRAVPAAMHIAHGAILTELGRAQEDYALDDGAVDAMLEAGAPLAEAI
jgi:hypothetical protein